MNNLKLLRCIISVLVVLSLLAGCSSLRQKEEENETDKNRSEAQKEDNSSEDSIKDDQEKDSAELAEPNETEKAETEPEVMQPLETEPQMVVTEPIAEPSILDYSYSLTPVATFSEVKNLAFSRYVPAVRVSKDDTLWDYLYSYTGSLMIQEPCNNYEYFGNGITAMYTYNGLTPSVRLVNIDTGDIYLDDPAIASITQLSERYYYTIHLGKMVSSSEDYFIQFRDTYSNPDSVYYEGYGQVYDITNDTFIDGIQVMEYSASAEPFTIGASLFVREEYGIYDIYIPMGSSMVKNEDVKIEYLTDSGYITKDGKDLLVYNSDCVLQYRVKNAESVSNFRSIHATGYSDIFYRNGEYQAYGIIDANGREMISGTFKSVRAERQYIVSQNDKDLYALYFADGSQCAPFAFNRIFSSADSILLSLESTSDGETRKYIFVPGGGLWDVTEFSGSEQVYYKKISSEEREYMILSTGKTMKLTNASSPYNGTLVKADEGLIDITNGSVLVGPGFDYLAVTQEYVYVYDNQQWTVYRLTQA